MKRLPDLKNPNILLWALLALWWVVNIIQASFTELANDEAYYYMFARNLDTGYFDHPPMIAFLVWMGNFIGGELGVRFFVTLLQPLYVYALWRIIKPADSGAADVKLFVLIAAAIPMLQLYGFVATPDAPLMFFTALFLLFYKKFTETDSWGSAALMGLAVAALAYSKYQGALVVLITIFSNPKLLKNPKFYFAGILALLLIAPHLWWQHEHDWASLRYHLVGRNRDFRWSYVSEYILNMFAVFNPFLFPVFLKGWWKSQAKEPVLRAMNAISLGFILFFLASTAKGHAQPQWVIPAAFGVIAILFQYARNREKLRNYTIKTAYITIILILLVRVEMIFNPLGIKFEIFDNKTSNAQLAELAAGRPIIFEGNYTKAAKYSFYAKGESFSDASVYNRTSQYEFWNTDEGFAGRGVVMEAYNVPSGKILKLDNGKDFSYIEVNNFIPVRKIEVTVTPELPEQVRRGEALELHLDIANPYPYEYIIDGAGTKISLVWNRKGDGPTMVPLDVTGTLAPHGTLHAETVTTVPDGLNPKDYTVGVMITNTPATSWYNGKTATVKVTE